MERTAWPWAKGRSPSSIQGDLSGRCLEVRRETQGHPSTTSVLLEKQEVRPPNKTGL